MKRTKLIMSIISCCFALSVLAFGVYASLSVNFNLSGKISFDPNGVDAGIETQVFKYTEDITHDDAYLKACDLQGEDFETLTSSYDVLTEKQIYSTKEGNTYYPNLEQNLSDNVLNFEDCNAYFIVVHVLPNDSYDLEEHNQIVFVELTEQSLPENVWLAYNDKYLVIYPSAQQDGGLNMVFFIGITEPYKQVPEKEFYLTLSFLYKDIFSTDWVSYEEAETLTEFVVPEQLNGEDVDYFVQDNDYFPCLEILICGQNISGDFFIWLNGAKNIIDQRNNEYSSLDGFLYNKDKSTLIIGTDQESVEIKSFVEEIGDLVFHTCSSLTNITIPDSVISIEFAAFEETNLSSIYIPASVQTMGSVVFCDIQNDNFKIYCEIQEKDIPKGWINSWNDKKNSNDSEKWPVVWGVTREQYNEIVNG